jgi:hypothetical protein
VDDDLENRDDNPFVKAAFEKAEHDDDIIEDLPEITETVFFGAELDVEAELEHQKKLDRIIADMKVTASDPFRDEKIRQRKIRIAAENKLKAVAGNDFADYPPPDPFAPDHAEPVAPRRPTIAQARRFGVKKKAG